MTGYTRPLSPVERLWLVADRMTPPFANQMVLEGAAGDATSFDEDAWRAAVAAAAAVNPGSRLVLRGALGRSHWIATDAPPPVLAVDGQGWDGRGTEGAPFLQAPLPPREGPTSAVVLIAGTPPRVAFRTLHAVMDGRGTLSFAEDVFRVLRGEPPVGADSRVNDVALAHSLDAGPADRRQEDCLAPTGAAHGTEPGVRWRRVTLRGRQPQLLPRVAVALAAIARRAASPGATGRVRFDVPVDLRPRRPGLRSTANLTGMVFADVAPDDRPEDFARRLRRELAARREASIHAGLEALPGVPLDLMTWAGRQGVRRNHAKSRYVATAVLSNLGRLPFPALTGGGFHATAGFFVPPATDSTAFFLSLAGSDDGVELAATCPRVLGTDGRLEAVLAELLRELEGYSAGD